MPKAEIATFLLEWLIELSKVIGLAGIITWPLFLYFKEKNKSDHELKLKEVDRCIQNDKHQMTIIAKETFRNEIDELNEKHDLYEIKRKYLKIKRDIDNGICKY